jgi:hypothetical protein
MASLLKVGVVEIWQEREPGGRALPAHGDGAEGPLP